MISRLIKYWLKNSLRNKFLTFSSVVVLTILMFFINILFVVHWLSNTLISSINSKLTIALYLKDDYSKDSIEVNTILTKIKENYPNIKTEFKTKNEVLDDLREKDEELVRIISTNSNPLPATINISNIYIDQYEWLNLIILEKWNILSDYKSNTVYDYSSQYKRIIKIINTLQTLKYVLYWIIWIFILSIFIINYSIIWNFIYFYKNEISITKLVWWSNLFIYWPFIFQSIFYCILSFLIANTFFLIWLNNLDFIFDKNIINSILWENFIKTLVVQIILFISVCSYSSFLSSKKYIKT